MRKLLATLVLGGTIAFGAPDSADAAKKKGDGLVNVVIGDVTIENISIVVAASLAAQACDLVDVGPVISIASKVDNTNQSERVCVQDDGDEVEIRQN